MKLRRVNFEGLHAAARRMGAADVDFVLDLQLAGIDPIDLNLAKGVVITLDGVDHDNGLLSFEGRQVLLYIQDHGRGVTKALEDGVAGRKYHVADCVTLKEMRARKRFERYVATNDMSDEFFVSGQDWETREEVEGMAQLKVCKNCLKGLNYKGYAVGRGKNAVFTAFSLEMFFSAYSSFFPHLPTQFAGPAAKDHYTADWRIIAGSYKASRDHICESCEVDLSGHRKCLHVHHVNGVKRDNATSNLRALCAECHRAQPCHGHMFVSREARRTIARLRRIQKRQGGRNWERVIDISDPGVEGLLIMCCHSEMALPQVGFEVGNDDGEVVAQLELAWPARMVGIAISEEDARGAESVGWEIWKVIDALDHFEKFVSECR